MLTFGDDKIRNRLAKAPFVVQQDAPSRICNLRMRNFPSQVPDLDAKPSITLRVGPPSAGPNTSLEFSRMVFADIHPNISIRQGRRAASLAAVTFSGACPLPFRLR